MEDKIIQILITGGTTSGMLVALGILYKIVSNHLHDATAAMNKLENAIIKLTQLLEDKL